MLKGLTERSENTEEIKADAVYNPCEISHTLTAIELCSAPASLPSPFTRVKLSGHGSEQQLQPSNQTSIKPPAWILHPSPSSLYCSQVHVTVPDFSLPFPPTARPQQKSGPTATKKHFHLGGSASKISDRCIRSRKQRVPLEALSGMKAME